MSFQRQRIVSMQSVNVKKCLFVALTYNHVSKFQRTILSTCQRGSVSTSLRMCASVSHAHVLVCVGYTNKAGRMDHSPTCMSKNPGPDDSFDKYRSIIFEFVSLECYPCSMPLFYNVSTLHQWRSTMHAVPRYASKYCLVTTVRRSIELIACELLHYP